jgi:hypothetical protein
MGGVIGKSSAGTFAGYTLVCTGVDFWRQKSGFPDVTCGPRVRISPTRPQIPGVTLMCRNIKTLANFDPPATDEEIRASALQFVRKLSGTTRPSQSNQVVFDEAVAEVTAVAHRLLESLTTNAPPRNRDEEARKGRARSMKRFGDVRA